MKPSIGRIVHFRLREQHAVEINRRRADAVASAISGEHAGAQVHVGNPVKGGDVYPMMITRVWSENPYENAPVQGQVFLDGNDVLWVTSVNQGDGHGQWFAPPRV